MVDINIVVTRRELRHLRRLQRNESAKVPNDVVFTLIERSFIRESSKGYQLTIAGGRVLQLDKETRMSRLIWSVLVPIFVAVVVARITSLLTVGALKLPTLPKQWFQ